MTPPNKVPSMRRPRRIDNERVVLCLSRRERRLKNSDCGRHVCGCTETLQASHQVEDDFIPSEGPSYHDNGHLCRAPDEDLPSAVNIRQTASKKEEASKGEIVGGDDLWLAFGGNLQVAPDTWEDDYSGLVGEGLQ